MTFKFCQIPIVYKQTFLSNNALNPQTHYKYLEKINPHRYKSPKYQQNPAKTAQNTCWSNSQKINSFLPRPHW